MATKATKSAPPPRTRLSKAEVQHEFEQIERRRKQPASPSTPKPIEADQRGSAELRAAVENVSVHRKSPGHVVALRWLALADGG